MKTWMRLVAGARLGAIAGLAAGNLGPGLAVGTVLDVSFAAMAEGQL